MKKFTITNSQNEKVVVDLVRYFKFKNDCYLIYTMNEVDEKNYLKLYLVRIMEELGFPIVQLIKNENDWAGMQNIIKKVIKEIKCEKYNYLEDLDYKTIDGIKITDARFFKLDPKLTNILSSNYFEEDAYDPSSTSDANSIGDGENNDNVGEYTESILDVPINTIGIDNTVDVNGTESLESVIPNDDINDNISINDSESLEPIEETIKKDSTFDPIESVNYVSEDVNKPVIIDSPTVDDNINVDLTIGTDVVSNNIQTENVDMVSTDIASDNNVNMIVDNIASIAVDVTADDISVVGNDDATDYKTLYLAAKKEVEVSNQLTDDLLEQLLIYKEKYGELEK